MDTSAEMLTSAERNVLDVHESIWLARVLRTGVLTAGILVLTGLILYLIGGHGGPATLDAALGKDAGAQPIRPSDIVDGLRAGSSGAYILTGLLVLILTPTVRVAMTVVLFLQHKDRLFAWLAAIVLVLLLLGLIGIGA